MARLKSALGVTHALLAGEPGDKVKRVAVLAGAGGELSYASVPITITDHDHVTITSTCLVSSSWTWTRSQGA